VSKLVTPDLSGPVPVARVAGEIDIGNAARVREEVLELAIQNADGMVVDLAEVPYLDSAGVKVMFDLVRDLRRRDQALVVTVPIGSPLRRLLKITNFQEAAPICDSIEAAVSLVRQLVEEPRN
jgi:anti-anti-sigma factor